MTDNPMRLTETGSVAQPSRCGARTRSGPPCKSAPVTGRRRCRMHGGADGSGAPEGSKNGNYKHGRYTKEVAATRQWLREATHMLRDLKKRSELQAWSVLPCVQCRTQREQERQVHRRGSGNSPVVTRGHKIASRF